MKPREMNGNGPSSSSTANLDGGKELDFQYEEDEEGYLEQKQKPQMDNRNYRMSKRPPAQVYYCEQCNKHIKYPSKIQEHIRKHTGEKPFICTFCGQRFTQSHTLKSHLRTHTGERPYKCSYCKQSFFTVPARISHERMHMEEQVDCKVKRDRYVPVEQAPEEQEEIQTQQILYECPHCRIQSTEEAEINEHINLEHRFEQVLYEDDVEHVEQDGGGVDEGNMQNIQMEPHLYAQKGTGIEEEWDRDMGKDFVCEPNQMLVADYNETGQMFGYYDEHQQFHEPAPNEHEPCTSTSSGIRMIKPEVPTEMMYFDKHNEVFEGAPMPLNEVEIQTSQDQLIDAVIYEHDPGNELEQEEEEMEEEIMIGEHGEDDRISVNHLYGHIVMDDTVQVVGEEGTKVRIVANPNPPKRGTQSKKARAAQNSSLQEVVVDASTLEMAAPIRHLKQDYLEEQVKKRIKNQPRNLDWIIDAVARGVDVSSASPHQRKKPVMHKCTYCGKVDKYPSKIQAHMRTHTGEKPFKCEICGMAFAQRTPMRLHLRRHLNQKPYQCYADGCKERFVSGALLRAHVEKKHYNKKKYICIRGCGRVFSSAYNQRHHESKCTHDMYTNVVPELEEEIEEEERFGEYQGNIDEEEYLDPNIDSTEDVQSLEETIGTEEPMFLHQ